MQKLLTICKQIKLIPYRETCCEIIVPQLLNRMWLPGVFVCVIKPKSCSSEDKCPKGKIKCCQSVPAMSTNVPAFHHCRAFFSFPLQLFQNDKTEVKCTGKPPLYLKMVTGGALTAWHRVVCTWVVRLSRVKQAWERVWQSNYSWFVTNFCLACRLIEVFFCFGQQSLHDQSNTSTFLPR